MKSDPTIAAALWRGHVLRFDSPPPPTYAPARGTALLLVVFVLEALLRPLLRLGARTLDFASSPLWPLTQVFILTSSAFGLAFAFAKVQPAALGLRPWRQWTRTEKLYFLQVIPLGVVVFSAVLAERVRALWAQPSLWGIGLTVFLPQMAWGFYQELLYRGMLQTELVRRLGSPSGLLLGNLLFTFGPLHAYHFSRAVDDRQHLWIFAAIFAVGLFFAVLFRRSGNLWIVGTMHGIGDFFVGGLRQLRP